MTTVIATSRVCAWLFQNPRAPNIRRYTKFRSFKNFHIEQAKGFKTYLAEQRSLKSDERLSKATLYATLTALKRFFVWLAGQPGFKSRISYSDAEYFNLSVKDARVAKSVRAERVPTLEQIRHVVLSMPSKTDIEKRNRALIAFTILTGARDGAIASFKICHLDVEQGQVDQDARVVKTKFSKSFLTTFFPVGFEIQAIVIDWVKYLVTEKLWCLSDPLFPATKIAVGSHRRFEAVGIERVHWSNAGPIRTIFKAAFSNVGLPYFNPHSFRKTLALLGGQRCRTPEEYKAWSQNLGHDNVLTTFSSYGGINNHRQAEIIKSFATPHSKEMLE